MSPPPSLYFFPPPPPGSRCRCPPHLHPAFLWWCQPFPSTPEKAGRPGQPASQPLCWGLQGLQLDSRLPGLIPRGCVPSRSPASLSASSLPLPRGPVLLLLAPEAAEKKRKLQSPWLLLVLLSLCPKSSEHEKLHFCVRTTQWVLHSCLRNKKKHLSNAYCVPNSI